jgi:outer membrane protein
MSTMLKLLFPLLIAFLANPVFAEFKVGYVNPSRVLSESPQAKKAAEKMKKDFEKREQDIQQLSKRLQSMQESMDKNGLTMSESERKNKEREIGELNRDFQRKQREFGEDVNLRRNEEMTSVFDRANKVIKQIAEADKFDLIIQEAVYFSPRIDITDKVIRALGDGAGAK